MSRSRRGLVTVVMAAVLGSALPAVPAAALSCAYFGIRDKAVLAEVIYVGVVIGEESRGENVIRYRMAVRRTIKGADRDERIMRSYTYEGYGEVREFARGKRILVVDNRFGDCAWSKARHVAERADRYYRILARGGWIAAPHTVGRGEYLWSMARDRLTFHDGDPTRRQIRRAADKIYDRNRDVIGPDRDDVRRGMRLMIPRLR